MHTNHFSPVRMLSLRACATMSMRHAFLGRVGWTTLSRTVFRALLCLATVTFVAALSWVPASSAHERVTVGEYDLTVGWRVEPPLTGLLNGLDLGIEHRLSNGTTEWVEGAESNLTATLSYGSDSVAKAVTPQEGRPGWYTFDVIPTREGIYSVHLVGTLNTTSVNVNVDLDRVDSASTVEFPATDPTPSELQNAIAGLRIQMTVATGIGVAGFAIAALSLAWTARIRRGGRDTP